MALHYTAFSLLLQRLFINILIPGLGSYCKPTIHFFSDTAYADLTKCPRTSIIKAMEQVYNSSWIVLLNMDFCLLKHMKVLITCDTNIYAIIIIEVLCPFQSPKVEWQLWMIWGKETDIHHNLFITVVWVQIRNRCSSTTELYDIQTTKCRLYGKLTIDGHFSIQSIHFRDASLNQGQSSVIANSVLKRFAKGATPTEMLFPPLSFGVYSNRR